MPRVLVLYPGPLAHLQDAAVAHRWKLRALGLRFVLATDDASDVRDGFFDEVIELPPSELVHEVWPVLRRELDARKFDALFAQSEPALLVGALAARHAGFVGPSIEAARACVDKFACRRSLAAAGVPEPRFALASSAREVDLFASEHGFPIVLKGVASARGRLVTRVLDRASIARAVERLQLGLARSQDVARWTNFARAAGLELDCDPTRQFLVESFARGDVLETDGVLARAEPISFGVTEQIPSIDPPFFIEGYATPADRAPATIERIEAISRRALAAVGLSDSGYSIEFRVDEDEIALIEINGRLGWDEGFGEMFEASVGVQPAICALQVALGRRPELVRTGVHAAVAYRCVYRDGRVVSVPSKRELAELASRDLAAAIHVAPGDSTHAPPHPNLLPHLARVLCSSRDSSRAAYTRAREAVDSLRFVLELEPNSNASCALAPNRQPTVESP